MKKKIITIITIFMCLLCPIAIKADSGMQAGYSNSGSLASAGVSSAPSSLSVLGEILKPQPGEKDYEECRIVIVVMCLIVIFIATIYYLLKLVKYDEEYKKKSKKMILLSLIPTIIYGVFCFLVSLALIIYTLITVIYFIIIKIVTNSKIKKKLKKRLLSAKEKDKKFNEEEFNKEAFNIYKDLQIAWMNFDLDKIKELVSEEIYTKYEKQLEQLKKDKQKNMMEEIEYKSGKLLDIQIKDDIETVVCEIKVKCLDYIIDEKENVIKGKKTKKRNYTYNLTFNTKIKNKKYILIKKELKQQ